MPPHLSRNIAKGFLAALWCTCLYRAVTQSIVHDEALTWQLYVNGPAAIIFQFFDANHHFLNTVLMRISAGIFGSSEWALRLPALAGAALYFVAVYRLARIAFGEGLMFLLAIAALTLNPFTLDFMVAARGYGLALALYTGALATLISPFRSNKDLLWSGITLALSVTANLVFALPAAFLALTFILTAPKPTAPEKKAKRKKGPGPTARNPVWLWFVLPAAAVGVLFLIVAPLASAERGDFYAGAATLTESLRSMASVAMQHGGPWRKSSVMNACRDIVAFGLGPLILLAGIAIGFKNRDNILLLVAAPAVSSAVLWILLHLLLNVAYPLDRTGIFFAPLVTITLLRLGTTLDWTRPVVYALVGAAIALFIVQFDTRKFLVWEYDADTRQLGQEIARRHDPKAEAVIVGGSWQLEPSLNFYRETYNWTWMQPLTRQPLQAPADFDALISQDATVLQSLGLKKLWQGPVSHSVLASK